MTTTPAKTWLASHVSIDSPDLARSETFYRALFDAEPSLARGDYVRFGRGESGLVLGLNARCSPARGTGSLQHLGLLFSDAEGLRATRERLARAGFETSGAEHVECCYAELDQFWASDPSGVRWELFLPHQEVLPAPAAASVAASCCAPSCCP